MAERWVIYDYDFDELATKTAYSSYVEAREDADQLDNVIVVSLGDVAPESCEDEIEESEEAEED